ncbi:MAG TPA: MaoC/PaaZ C-terminal domain-containing protein [Acidimicrobiales bacterium]|nr:MaoC/PaaZ C-terminal domain-containing protein [Acidimicrobiales bacterium]
MAVPNMDVVGRESPPVERSWDSKDALLYAVGVGAGAEDPLDGRELKYTTENSIDVEQRVLPTFAVIIAGGGADFRAIGEINMANLVHGEQSIVLHRPIPVSGTVRNTGKVTGIYDKGSGMVIVSESTAVLADTGEPLATTSMSAFIRGAGGWGGDRGPSGPKNVPPDRDPDHVVTYRTRIDQALTYRLSGDRNPLHSDPAFAAKAGFPRPILHGLCTYGFTGRALLHSLCESDDRRFTGMEARFARPVFPGQALTVRIWRTGPGEALYVTENDAGDVVISEGRCTFTD